MDYAAAGSTSFTYKECKVNCSSSGGSKAQATTTSVYPAVCHVSATIQYTSKKDASVRNDATSEKKAKIIEVIVIVTFYLLGINSSYILFMGFGFCLCATMLLVAKIIRQEVMI